MVYFLFYIIAILAVPGDSKKYNVFIIPLKNPARTRMLEVFLLPRNKLTDHKRNFDRLDIEHDFQPTTVPDLTDFQELSDYSMDRNNIRHLNYRARDETDGLTEAEESKENDEDRIVGGTDVDINMYPYHVAYGTNCGGAIIGKKWVLTAGHCGKKAYIRTGSKYLNQGKMTAVAGHHIHPLWSAKSKEHPFDYDFQVLELAIELKYDENTQPIKVARIEDMVVGKLVTVTGWGNTVEDGSYSRILQAVSVPIINKDSCQRVPFPYFRGSLTPRMFCAGLAVGHKDACQGDSGGPAVASDRLLGMVSFGYGCATPGSYGVYSKVAKVRDWIESVTKLTLD